MNTYNIVIFKDGQEYKYVISATTKLKAQIKAYNIHHSNMNHAAA